MKIIPSIILSILGILFLAININSFVSILGIFNIIVGGIGIGVSLRQRNDTYHAKGEEVKE